MEIIQEWVRNIFIFILALTFIEMLMPSGNIKPYLKYVFALAIMASIIAPVSALLE